MVSNRNILAKHSGSGILAIIFVGIALLLQFVFFPMRTIRVNDLTYETYPTLALFSLLLLFIGIALSSIGIRGWNKTLPAFAFVLSGISILSWIIMFLLGSN